MIRAIGVALADDGCSSCGSECNISIGDGMKFKRKCHAIANKRKINVRLPVIFKFKFLSVISLVYNQGEGGPCHYICLPSCVHEYADEILVVIIGYPHLRCKIKSLARSIEQQQYGGALDNIQTKFWTELVELRFKSTFPANHRNRVHELEFLSLPGILWRMLKGRKTLRLKPSRGLRSFRIPPPRESFLEGKL
ncbi:hypothetical protein VNO77_07590 [Canavalia gladiata]|uniref:Uncharacterized protein n=1 Tax=Canavalia gladiata TaxID=3824 RepID=A0AAN9M7R4_CANGL